MSEQWAVDGGEMGERIAGLPAQLATTWREVRQPDIPDRHSDVFSLVVLGQGVAALGGELLRGAVAHTAAIPVVVVRGYDLPGFVGPDTLVIACSHSGDTEETVAAFEEAADRGAKLAVITTGGALAAIARSRRCPLIAYRADGPPRADLGASLPGLLALARAVHVYTGNLDNDIADAVAALTAARDIFAPSIPTADNAAKQIAQSFVGKIPAIYGAGILASAAQWWVSQLAANAKTTALAATPVETNHVGAAGFGASSGHLAAVLMHSTYDHPRAQLHRQITADLLAQAGVPTHTLVAQGRSRLAQMLWAVSCGDWVSYYLALLLGVDPLGEDAVQYMKDTLAQ